MAISRLSRTTYPLILIVLYGCGGLGVSSRASLVVERPTGAGARNSGAATEVAETGINRGSADLQNYFEKWLGTPYLFGGTDSKGIDCSSLTSHYYKDVHNLSIPRTTTSQYLESDAVDATRARPGDLVFFQNTYRPGISHVGIYLGGDDFVHAGSKGVDIASLENPYFKQRFIGFRRFHD
jgi:cell wall-associated NlpC family hydrolase